MIDFINGLRKPDSISLWDVRKYDDTTPSVTGLLSLIDSFIPKNEEALTRWTYIHKFMEDILSWKATKSWKYQAYITSVLPYIYLFKPLDGEVIMLEEKLKVPWVFWGTLDYIKKLNKSSCVLTDFKTSSKLAVPSSWSMLDKYDMQAEWYAILIHEVLKLKVLAKDLFFISPKGCVKKSIVNANMFSSVMKHKINCLIMYYHILNWTHTSEQLKDYYKNNTGDLMDLMHYTEQDWVEDVIQQCLFKWISETLKSYEA